MEQMARRRKHFFYEANVGAGLPIMSTLRDLIASGDEILKIEGILSGTLSYLFNTFDGSAPFSALVKEAHRVGFTEPDPRDDLSARTWQEAVDSGAEIGLKMELDEVTVDSLVPRPLRSGKFSSRFFSDLRGTTTKSPIESPVRRGGATSCGMSVCSSAAAHRRASRSSRGCILSQPPRRGTT
jgi:aspartokinase/homoserine dehydrogenase 1